MRTGAIVAVLCALGLTAAYVAIAASAAPPQTIGVISVERVFDEYDKAKKGTAELQAMTKDLEAQLKWMARHRLLTDKEITELVNLHTKDKPTDADKARIAALEDLDKQREAKIQSLRSEQEPTDQQKQELVELQRNAGQSAKAIEEAQASFRKKIADRNTQLTEEVKNDLRAAVGVVSQQKNTPVVLQKAVVIQGGTDITDAALKELNKK